MRKPARGLVGRQTTTRRPQACVDHFGITLLAGQPTGLVRRVATGIILFRGGVGETILLAEDEELVRNLTAAILTRGGYRLLVACDGQEAVDLLDAHGDEVDLAVVDAVMPNKGGKDVQQGIIARGLNIPALFSSGYSHEVLGPDELAEGSQLIQKPYSAQALLNRTRSMLSARAGR